MPKMNITYCGIDDYGKNSELLPMEKQSQNKPNQSQFTVSLSNLFQTCNLRKGGNPLKILKIFTVQHLTYLCNPLKYWFSYGYGNFYEKLFGEKR